MTCLRVLALVLLLSAPGVQAQDSGDAQRKLEQAQRELKAVAAERRKIEGQRGSASKELRTLDEKLGRASRALHETETALKQQQQALAELEQKRDGLQTSLDRQRRDLRALLRSAYTIGEAAPLKLLLSQDSVASASRLLTWHRYLQQDRTRRLAAIASELQSLEAVEQRIAAEREALDATRKRQREQLAALQGERKNHAKSVAKLDARYQDRRSREKALGSDVAGLKKLLARLREAAKRAEAARKAEAAARRAAPPKAGKPAPVVAKRAALQVGGLGWPLSGSLLAGFGGKLPDGGKSDGLLIGASAGTPVKAVADGTVVFSDWMNGYGQILIIDHGNGYMSLYAHNEALLRDTGAQVRRGDTVASVGSSGSSGATALYFELRRNGDPVNPNTWLKK